MPDHLTVCRVEKRNSIPSIVQGAVRYTFGVSFGLTQNALWAEGQLLGFNDAQDRAIHAERIIGRPVGSLELSDRAVPVGVKRHAGRKRNDVPSRSLQLRVDETLASKPLGVLL